jgi:uncharacterized protein YecE (DUF72 family)
MSPRARPADPSDAPEAAATVRIGISGWRYEPGRGVFYPPTLVQKDELRYASRQFRTIEINGSFYSLQRPDYYERWHDETPEGFVFADKGPRFVTHMLKLKGVEAAMGNFFASGVARLRAKLGPFLWQLPPMLRFDAERLAPFLAMLPRDSDQAGALARRHNDKVTGRCCLRFATPGRLRHALEVRHESFVTPAFVDLLRRHDVALVVADTAGKWPYAEDITSDFVYARLHGDKELYVSGYTPTALKRWAQRIEHWKAGRIAPDPTLIDPLSHAAHGPRDVYAYFDNDAKVKAPRDATRLAALLGVGIRPTGRAGATRDAVATALAAR